MLFSSAHWWWQSNICEKSQLGRRVQVFLADSGQAADVACADPLQHPESKKLGDLEAKQIFSLDGINVFLHADVGKSSFEWKGHYNSSSAEPAPVYVVN